MRRKDEDGPRLEVLFNVNDAAIPGQDGYLYADQAAVLRYPAAEAQWPLEPLNTALGVIYVQSEQTPQIYPVHSMGRVIGYMAMEREDGLSAAELLDRFKQILLYREAIVETDSGFDYTMGTPVQEWAFWNDNGTQPIAVVGFEPRYAGEVEFPYQGVNHALWSLRGQTYWPDQTCLFLYPVCPGESTLAGGVLVAPLMDDFGENKFLDDSMVHAIVSCNANPKIYSNYPAELQPERLPL